MGVFEEIEPPFKRIKLHIGGSNSFTHENTKHSVFDSGDLMAKPLASQGDIETIGSKGFIKRKEFIKVITRTLYSLGYEKTGALLEEESGISLYSSEFSVFTKHVMNGKWDDSVATLSKLGDLDETTIKSASFLLLEQKFFDILRMEKVNAALDVLRNEIAPLRINEGRIHELTSCIISPSRFAGLGLSVPNAKSRSKILEKLEKVLPACVMVPGNRLEHLIEEALDAQCDACLFHNTLDSDLSLYSDHRCGKDHIAFETLQVLDAHTDEVWFLQFSHSGKYLASSSKDQTAILWEVTEHGQVKLKHKLSGHQKPVLSVSWSPDDKQLLTCSDEESIRRWDVSSGECLHIYEKPGVGSISCGWFLGGKGIFAGLTDKSISLWSLDGKVLESWKGRTLKISDMVITGDGKRIISRCRENTILILDREAKLERFIEEKHTITSFSLSEDSKFLLVNLLNQEIHLWNLEDLKFVSKYEGHRRARFVIRSCFGGLKQAFIASGSEDSQVYIWHRSSGVLLLALPGHSGAVNCISWNPSNHHMLASASDDRTIRIWGLAKVNVKPKVECNGNVQHLCNGRS
ncbi:hypothetical protein ACFE04_018546 [Oxalis oulophora]